MAQLDAAALGRTYGSGWLAAASAVGALLAVVGVVGALAGGGGGATAEPFAVGTALLVLPLFELWGRRRAAEGKTPPLLWLRRLDDRVLTRRASYDAQKAAVRALDSLRAALIDAGLDGWVGPLFGSTGPVQTAEDLVGNAAPVIEKLVSSGVAEQSGISQQAATTLAILAYASECIRRDRGRSS